MNITPRRVLLVGLGLVILVLIYLMVTDTPAGALATLPKGHTAALAGRRLHVLAFICSLGGFVAGGGSVYIYAKATNQKIEWRGVPIVGRIYLCIWPESERRHAS